jgi:hypothetical protein
MGLETASFIDGLNTSNPAATDGLGQADDHIRLIKSAVKATFPNVTGAVNSDHTELNVLDGITSTTAELNILSGVTATTAELNYTDGVTSNIQTQLDAKTAGVTAGAGLSGGGTSGSPTITHGSTSSQASVNNSGLTFIQDVTLDNFGHVTGLTSSTVTIPTLSGPFAESYVSLNNFGTTPTQVDGFGISSVSRPGIGDLAFVFSSAQANTNYVVDAHHQNVLGSDGRWQWWLIAKSTTGFTVRHRFTTLAAQDVDVWVCAKRLT